MFSERLQRRYRLWWGKRQGIARRLHRFWELSHLKSCDDTDDTWRCCGLWQRRLLNKWNSREFVRRRGFRVPALYGLGRRVAKLPFASLPAHFVVKPVVGAACHGVHVISDDVDLLTGERLDRERLRACLRRERGWLPRFPLLVEELVRSEDGGVRLPIEYKCHMFGDVVGAIEAIVRHGPHQEDSVRNFYTPDWRRFEQPLRALPLAEVRRPRCLDEIVAVAKALGTAYGTYIRVDLYASDKGCVFGEFSSIPGGPHGLYTDFAETYLEELWRAHFPDAT